MMHSPSLRQPRRINGSASSADSSSVPSEATLRCRPETLYEADKISGMYWNGSRSRSKCLCLLLNNIVIIVEYFKYTREIYCSGVWIADVAQPVRCRYNANEGRQ